MWNEVYCRKGISEFYVMNCAREQRGYGGRKLASHPLPYEAGFVNTDQKQKELEIESRD